jgi:hypothetical protein
MQSCGYEGSHSEPEEEEEEEGREELTTVVVVAVVTAKVGGVIDISTNSTSNSTTLIIGSEKHEYHLKELMQSSSIAKHIKASWPKWPAYHSTTP